MFELFKTDFYQLSMTTAYILSNHANDLTGFECFVRRVKKQTNPTEQYYLFQQKELVDNAMECIRKELAEPKLFYVFWEIIKHKTDEKFYESLKELWRTLKTDFTYNVLPNNSLIKPFIPVFQYSGPRWVGQILETYVLNLINGKIGLDTYKECYKINEESPIYKMMHDVVYGNKESQNYQDYLEKVKTRLKEYRDSTSSILLEAGFRRAPGFNIALDVSVLSKEYGWNGTSNVSASMGNNVPSEYIGGSCAHAFIMSYETELEAFENWNNIYPNSTILIDTYDTKEAIKKLVDANIKPSDVRIDSEPLDDLAFMVREILDKKGWTDVGIFLSGDLTPEKLKEYHDRKVPFNKCMAGTKLLNLDEMNGVNTGLVYKLVEYERNGKTYFPEKKSTNKGSIAMLKKVIVDYNGYHFEHGFDLSQVKDLEPDMQLVG